MNIFDNDIKKQFIINSFTQTVLSLSFFEISKLLPESFFQVLMGIRKSSIINLEINLIKKIQLLIFYLRLISGIELYLVKKDNDFFFINIDDNFSKIIEKNKFISYKKFVEDFINENINQNINIESNLKELFLNCIYRRNIIKIKSPIKDIVILTHNRPDYLRKTIQEYINNFNIFGLTDIKITISDDSDEEYYIKNKEVLKNIDYDIEHIYLTEKYKIINNIKEEYSKYSDLLDYMFGLNNFKSNVARNRNFVSLLFKNKSFISIDDDSRPLVLTYSFQIINNSIQKMFENNDFNLINIEKYIENDNKIFLPVNFIGNFSNYDLGILKYSKYSGIRDTSLFYHLDKLFSFYLTNNINNLLEVSTFTEKFFSEVLQGLCIYFNNDHIKYSYSLPEDFRLEDIFIGLNYSSYSSYYPISTNFSLYHNKKINIQNINYNHLKNEIISTIVFFIYKTFTKNGILYSEENINILINNDMFIKIHSEIKNVYNLFINYYNLFLNKDLEIANYISYILISIKKEFIDYDYRNDIKNYINNIFFNYFNSYKLWLMINNN